MNINADFAREDKSKKLADKSFADWMDLPMTRLALSMLAPTENHDVLPTLLRSAFDCGHGSGSAFVAMELISGMLARKPGVDR